MLYSSTIFDISDIRIQLFTNSSVVVMDQANKSIGQKCNFCYHFSMVPPQCTHMMTLCRHMSTFLNFHSNSLE
jgi:hypothetical protein